MASTTSVIDAVNSLLHRKLTSYGSPLPPDARRYVKRYTYHHEELDLTLLRLQKDVHDVVRRYRWDASKPPFSLAQIIIMSAVPSLHWWNCKRGSAHVVCVSDVIKQIDRRFKYYHNMQIKRLWGVSEPYRCSRFLCYPETSPASVKRTVVRQRRNAGPLPTEEEAHLRAEVDTLAEVQHTLELYDLPLWTRDSSGDYFAWSLKVGPIRAFLRDVVSPVRGQGFPFMRLPQEIRLRIYEHTLRYPSSELRFSTVGSRFRIRGSQLGTIKSRIRSKKPYQPVYTELPDKLLALLLVSKEVLKEAMPIFYRDSSFHAASPLHLINLLRGCGARRRKYFTDISVDCSLRSDAAPAEVAFRLLAGVPGLRCLTLKIWDLQWLLKERPQITRRGVHINTASMWDVGDIPALVELGKCKVHQIIFRGDCTRIIAYVKEHVLAPMDVAERMLEIEEAEKVRAAFPKADAREVFWRQHEGEADRRLQSAQNLEAYFARFGRTTIVDF